MKKIWFLCQECWKYHWLPATKYLISYYESLGDDCSFCPNCDDEQPTRMSIGSKPSDVRFVL